MYQYSVSMNGPPVSGGIDKLMLPCFTVTVIFGTTSNIGVQFVCACTTPGVFVFAGHASDRGIATRMLFTGIRRSGITGRKPFELNL